MRGGARRNRTADLSMAFSALGAELLAHCLPPGTESYDMASSVALALAVAAVPFAPGLGRPAPARILSWRSRRRLMLGESSTGVASGARRGPPVRHALQRTYGAGGAAGGCLRAA